MKKNVLINAANLHVGGGVQVAVSFVYEMARLGDYDFSHVDVIVSSAVNEGVARLEVDTAKFRSYRVVDLVGLRALFSPLNREIKNWDIVFTIFGPCYFRFKARREVVGFAQPWILNFRNPVAVSLNIVARNRLRIKFLLQWLFFKRADHYIVELEHVKRGLQLKGVDAKDISIVYNTVSSLYLTPEKWRRVEINKGSEQLSFGIVTRDYPHKNLSVLPHVAEILKDRFDLCVRFYVSLNKDEWALRDCFFKKYVTAVGSLSPEECPLFYQAMDGVIFPSLLECFSATPLEAMVMQRPLFASERGFVRDVCAEHAVYFDPLDPESIARSIFEYFASDVDRTQQLRLAREHALSFSSAPERAVKYLEIIKKLLND